MRRLKNLTVKIIIYITIFMLCLSNIAYAYSAEEVGNAIAGYAKNYVEEGNKKNILRYDLNNGKYKYSHWDPENSTSNDGLHWFCCGTFVSCMYWKVTGGVLSPQTDAAVECLNWGTKKGSEVNLNDVKPGDILWRSRSGGTGHTAIFIGDNKIAQASTSQPPTTEQINIKEYDTSKWEKAARISDTTAATVKTLDTTYSMTGSSNSIESSKTSIDYSNFFFNGIPDGKYSLASRKNIFEIIIDALKDLVNFLIGLITYLFRGVIIGIISIFDRLINNTIDSIENSPKTLQESGVRGTSADDPSKMNRSVTLEDLIFGDLDLFDINIFKVD